MKRFKIIPISVAAACGLALQFQASGANAQQTPEFGTAGNTYNTNVIPGFSMFEGNPGICFPVVGNCLNMQTDGNLVLYSFEGVAIWASNTWGDAGDYMVFNTIGDFQVTNVNAAGDPYVALWNAGTYLGGPNDWSGSPGYFLAVQDDGNLVVYDSYLNAVWAATWDPNYNWGEASNVKQACFSADACW
jgi:hypothetical protein